MTVLGIKLQYEHMCVCAQNALVDARDHLGSGFTPFQAEVAFGDRDWCLSAYSAEFAHVLRPKVATF